MNEKKLYDAITEVKEVYIEEARITKLNKQKVQWKKWMAIAASMIIIISMGGAFLFSYLMGNDGANNYFVGNGGAGHDDSSIFMSYAGPVFALTLEESDDEIYAERNISYDFSIEDENSIRLSGSEIKDNYILTNTSDGNKIIKAIYPFVGTYNELKEQLPVIKVDGQEILQSLYAGNYSDSITGTLGEEDMEVDLNTPELSSWEDYKALLQDGSYQENAFELFEVPSQPVTIYTFNPEQLAPEEYSAATQAVSFTIDPNKTTILQYGFNGGEYGEDGFRRFSYFVPNGRRQDSGMKMLIVIGDDITDYKLQGYINGGCETGEELEGITANVTREEDLLSNITSEIIDNYIVQYDREHSLLDKKEMLLNDVLESMIQHGLLSEHEGSYYQEGMMEEIIMSEMTMKRVFYVAFDLSVLAESSATVSVQTHKEPSFDYAGSGSNNKGIEGYDMVTQLGTNLSFNEVTAEITSWEHIEIVRQNFGFDLKQNLTKVSLDPSVERYYLEIRRIKE